jgi:HD-like signal output (HDOD) protein
MTLDLKEVVKDVDKLVSFPTVANELIALVDDDSAGAAEISATIQNDPALAASLLKLANSAWYMSREPTDSIDGAVVRIGLGDIGRIALNICMQESFKDIPENIFSVSDYFNHSLRCAFACLVVAEHCGIQHAGTMYTAGLLHDIGQLILLNLYPKESLQALSMNIDFNDGQKLHLSENKVFGIDHTQIGHELAKKWNFSTLLQQCIRYHHIPNQAEAYELEVCCIHIANSIATMNEFESTDISDAAEIHPFALETCNLNETKIIEIAKSSLALFTKHKEKMSDTPRNDH